MEGTVFQRDVDRPVRFQRGAVPIEARLAHVRLYVEPHGARTLVAAVAVDFFVFQRIEDHEAFGLTRESIDPQVTQWELGSDRPVELELRLEGAARAALDRFAGPEEILDAYVRGVTEACAPDAAGAESDADALCDADAYRYLSVLQERPMGRSTARVGFRSVYAGPSGTR